MAFHLYALTAAGLLLVGSILIVPKGELHPQEKAIGPAGAVDLHGSGFAIAGQEDAEAAAAPAIGAEGGPVDAGTDFRKYLFDPDALAVDPVDRNPFNATQPWP